MRKDNFLFLVILLIFIASCDEDNIVLDNTTGKIKTVNAQVYTYNADGYVDKIYTNDSSQTYYIYRNDTVLEYRVYVNQYITHRIDTTQLSYYALRNNLSVHHNLYTYNGGNFDQYNTDGTISFRRFYRDVGYVNQYLFYENGNLIKVLDTVVTYDIMQIDSVVYFYDFSKMNSLSNENYGKSFLGKSSKNLQTKVIVYTKNFNQIGPIPSNDTVIYNYTYSFDASDRVIQRNRTDIQSYGSSVYTENFTYY